MLQSTSTENRSYLPALAEAALYGLNLFVVLVGESSKARKGTSWNQIDRVEMEESPADDEPAGEG